MTLIEEYRKIAKERWEYLEHGNSRKGNKCFDKLDKIANSPRYGFEITTPRPPSSTPVDTLVP